MRLILFLDVPAEHIAAATAFWSAATGWTPSRPRGEGGQFVTLQPPAGRSWLKLQAVNGPGGMHLDLDGTDRPAAVERTIGLGATRAWTYHEVPVMRSPGGLLHCHTLDDGAAAVYPENHVSVLDQICLDIPAPMFDREVAYWQAVTGRVLEAGALPEFQFLSPTPDDPVRVLLQRLDTAEGAVRAHPDFATARRDEEVARHRDLGAAHVADHEFWTVLRAPGGQVYCITDRDPRTGRLLSRPAVSDTT